MEQEKKALGNIGEEIAAETLIAKGYKILHRNWYYNHKEIDIIALEGNLLVVVEVKTRSEDFFEEPWQAVSDKKIRFLADATEAYIAKYKIDREVRFDVVSIVLKENKPEIEHIIDAFRPWM